MHTATAIAIAAVTATTTIRPHTEHQHHLPPPPPHQSNHQQHHQLVLAPSKTPRIPPISLPPRKPLKPPDPGRLDEFRDKILFLDSVGLDGLSLAEVHPAVLSSTSLPTLRSTVDLLRCSAGLSSLDLRRIFVMCPDLLSLPPSSILPVLTFLLREARLDSIPSLRAAIIRRPRLLSSSVERRLRPSLYFLQSIGIAQVHKHTNLLSCSVEDKFVPRIEYFRKVGFSERDARTMFRRFPQLFCYSVEENLEVKFNYFVVEMGRELRELTDFPQYFSFSLENRIKPRHAACLERRVCLGLPAMLKSSEEVFRRRLDVCCGSTMPQPSSPLSCTNCEVESL